MENDVLNFLNQRIREEHGNRVNIDSKWIDAEVDSFGTTVIFLDMDEKYGCFNKEWFSNVVWVDELDPEGNVLAHGLTIRDIVERVKNESTIV